MPHARFHRQWVSRTPIWNRLEPGRMRNLPRYPAEPFTAESRDLERRVAIIFREFHTIVFQFFRVAFCDSLSNARIARFSGKISLACLRTSLASRILFCDKY